MTKDELLKLVTVLQAELEATNRQVEILSDVLAESRREVAALKINAALDKMAENARELGLDYEPVLDVSLIDEGKTAAPVQDLPFGVGGGLVAIKTLLSRDPCVHANTAIEMIDAILKEHTAAQHEPENEPFVSLASVQEPVQATMKLESSGPGHGPAPNQKLSVRHVSLIDAGKTPPAAPVQPVQEPEIVQRVKRYAGQTMRTARNPNITARECIELANWIVATPPAAAPVEDVDWKEQYEKQKRRSDMWVAKYEKDIGPIEYTAPAAAQPAPTVQEPVATVIEELEHDGEGFCAKVRWLYNPVPVGETLSWEQPK
jgi:hypothetical protein